MRRPATWGTLHPTNAGPLTLRARAPAPLPVGYSPCPGVGARLETWWPVKPRREWLGAAVGPGRTGCRPARVSTADRISVAFCSSRTNILRWFSVRRILTVLGRPTGCGYRRHCCTSAQRGCTGRATYPSTPSTAHVVSPQPHRRRESRLGRLGAGHGGGSVSEGRWESCLPRSGRGPTRQLDLAWIRRCDANRQRRGGGRQRSYLRMWPRGGRPDKYSP